MPPKSSLELSEVQTKVVEELDVLTDAFTSTLKQIGKVIKAYSEEISVLIDRFVNEKKGWRLYESQCYDLLFIPFREYSWEKKFTIDSLDQQFWVSGQKILVKESLSEGKKKQLNFLSISWGFRYYKEDTPTKYFYFEIEIDKETDGIIFSRNEYDKLEKKIKESIGISEEKFSEANHPDDGDSEKFFVWLDVKYLNQLSNFFLICKEEIVSKLVSRIKVK